MIRSTPIPLPTNSWFVPYATSGVGGFTMFNKASLGINSNGTFLTGNVGGGLKWYAPNGRWGRRGINNAVRHSIATPAARKA